MKSQQQQQNTHSDHSHSLRWTFNFMAKIKATHKMKRAKNKNYIQWIVSQAFDFSKKCFSELLIFLWYAQHTNDLSLKHSNPLFRMAKTCRITYECALCSACCIMNNWPTVAVYECVLCIQHYSQISSELKRFARARARMYVCALLDLKSAKQVSNSFLLLINSNSWHL